MKGWRGVLEGIAGEKVWCMGRTERWRGHKDLPGRTEQAALEKRTEPATTGVAEMKAMMEGGARSVGDGVDGSGVGRWCGFVQVGERGRRRGSGTGTAQTLPKGEREGGGEKAGVEKADAPWVDGWPGAAMREVQCRLGREIIREAALEEL